MLLTTTPSFEGRPIQTYHGIVTGEAIVGAHLFQDLFANMLMVTASGTAVKLR